MPLEISEIGVRLAVREGGGQASGRSSSECGGEGDDQGEMNGASLNDTQINDIVSRCVRRVLAVLRATETR